jgi:hypothetical protein
MHVFLRVVRVLVPVALIAVAVAAVVSVLSARPDLSNARSRVDGAWSQLAPRLDTRYQLLADASTKLSAVQGPVHSVAGGVNTAVVRWRQDRQSHAPVAEQVRAANDLEATGRQLVATASASPRVKGDAPAQAALDAYLSDKALSAAAGSNGFNPTVAAYERERRGPVRAVVASMFGDGNIPALDTTGV